MILVIRKVIQQKVWPVNNSFRHMKQVFFQACVDMIRSGNLQLNLQHLETVADFGTQEVKLINRRTALHSLLDQGPPWEERNIPKGTASNGYEAKFKHSY